MSGLVFWYLSEKKEMEEEKFIKRLEWLDKERRKEKEKINTLEETSARLGEELSAASKQIKDLSAEVTRLVAQQGRVAQFDEALSQFRKEITRI
ncbi:MAG: hypothetical protein AB1345_14280, partial [Chloroflexota bacterium]